jgi:NADH-quinone oxidoreductase subunit I
MGMELKKYFARWVDAIRPLLYGLRLSARHLKNARRRKRPDAAQAPDYFLQPPGLVTIQYPQEKIPTPDVGRYKLFLEIDDCIGCDQCARVCPVDCITIEKVKSVDVIGTTSDGTKKRFYLPVFDIDLAKCCFCGLCTVVCPTECLIMTDEYEYGSYDRLNFIDRWGNLTPEQRAEKEAELAAFEAEKKKALKKV